MSSEEEDERARERERETPWRLGFRRWGWGFWGVIKPGFWVQVRGVSKVGVLPRVTVRKHVEVLGPPPNTTLLP